MGVFLYTGGLISFLLGLSWGGQGGHSWTSSSVIAPIVLGGFSFIACFAYDFLVMEKMARQALFPKDLMTRYREYTVSLGVVFVAGMVYYSMSALLPEATIYVFTNEPLQVGIIQLPNGLGQVLALLVPLFFHKTQRPKVFIVAAILVQTLATGLYSYGVSGHKAAWIAFQAFGQGCFSLLTVATIFNSGLYVPASKLGVAVGLLGTFRSMGGSVGNVIFNTVLGSKIKTELPARISEAAVASGFTGDISALIRAAMETGSEFSGAFTVVSGTTQEIEAAIISACHAAYSAAFRSVFYITIPFGIFALIAALFIKDASQLMTNHIEVHLEKDILKGLEHAGAKTEEETNISSADI